MRTLKEFTSNLGKPFLTRGRKTQYLTNGKTKAFIHNKWQIFESMQDLKKQLQEEDFIKERSWDININNIFVELPFLGEEGFKIALKKINTIENRLFKYEKEEDFSDLKIAIWSKYKGLPDNSFQNCKTGKIYSSIDDIDNEENLDENTKDNLNYFFLIAPTIPSHEIWYAYYLYNNIQNLTITNEGYKINSANKVYEVPEESSLYDEITNNEFGIVFCGKKDEEDNICYDVNLNNYKGLDGVCTISTTLQDQSNVLSTIQMYLSAFKSLDEYLSNSDIYKSIIDNEFFQNFIINYISYQDKKGIEYNVKDFTNALYEAMDEELEKLESDDFLKSFNLILKSEVVKNWKNSIEELQELLAREDSNEVFTKLITARNILFNIKNKLQFLKENKKSLNKKLTEELQFRMTKDREGAFVNVVNNRDYYYPDNYRKVNIENQPWDKDQVRIKPEIWAKGEEEMLKKSKERKPYDTSYENKALNKREIDRWGSQAKKVIDDTLFTKKKTVKKGKLKEETTEETSVIWTDNIEEARSICLKEYYKYFAEGSIQKLLEDGTKATYGFVVDSKKRPLAGIAVLLDGKKDDVCKDEKLPYLWELASTTNDPERLENNQELCPFSQKGTGTQLAELFAENVNYKFWFKTASVSADNYWKDVTKKGKLGKVITLYKIGTTIWGTPIYQTVAPKN